MNGSGYSPPSAKNIVFELLTRSQISAVLARMIPLRDSSWLYLNASIAGTVESPKVKAVIVKVMSESIIKWIGFACLLLLIMRAVTTYSDAPDAAPNRTNSAVANGAAKSVIPLHTGGLITAQSDLSAKTAGILFDGGTLSIYLDDSHRWTMSQTDYREFQNGDTSSSFSFGDSGRAIATTGANRIYATVIDGTSTIEIVADPSGRIIEWHVVDLAAESLENDYVIEGVHRQTYE